MLRSRPTSVSTSSNQDATSANKLTIPSLPPDCNRRDFEDVKFWTRGDWQRHQKSCEERGKDYKKLDFLTDADGQPIDDDRIDSMTKHARLLWNSLYKEREDPDTWGVRSMFASGYFGNHMQIKYPEFQWCEGDWKVHAFATIRFPDWSQDVRRRGRFTRIFLQSNHILLLLSLLFQVLNPRFRNERLRMKKLTAKRKKRNTVKMKRLHLISTSSTSPMKLPLLPCHPPTPSSTSQMKLLLLQSHPPTPSSTSLMKLLLLPSHPPTPFNLLPQVLTQLNLLQLLVFRILTLALVLVQHTNQQQSKISLHKRHPQIVLRRWMVQLNRLKTKSESRQMRMM